MLSILPCFFPLLCNNWHLRFWEMALFSKSNSTLPNYMGSSLYANWADAWEIINTSFPFFLTCYPRKAILWVQVGLFRDTITVTEKIHCLWFFITGYKSTSVSLVSSSCAFSFVHYVSSDNNKTTQYKATLPVCMEGMGSRTKSRHSPFN